MPRVIAALVATLSLTVFAPSASASLPRTGVLDAPLGNLIIDIFDSEKVSFGPTGTWGEWTPPVGVTYAIFELVGGAGESGEGHGHVAAGVDLEPGETYWISVGGGGEDTSAFSSWCLTPEWWECGGTVIAAGGDSAMSLHQTNLIPSEASWPIEVWEGGGPDSEAGPGWATIHYWPEGDDAPSGQEPGESDPMDNADLSTPFVSPQGVVPDPCKVRRKGQRPELIKIGSGRLGLGRARAVSPRRSKTCARTRR